MIHCLEEGRGPFVAVLSFLISEKGEEARNDVRSNKREAKRNVEKISAGTETKTPAENNRPKNEKEKEVFPITTDRRNEGGRTSTRKR